MQSQALLVVEAGSIQRTVAAEMRLAASALYGLLGAPASAAASYSVLECKHIQHDTLSGMPCPAQPHTAVAVSF